ncbi:MAG: hypothetical protein ACK5WZ_08110, partial [Pseudobdellovibrionaceae bacterium]
MATGIAILAGFVGLSLLGGYIFRIEKTLRYNTIYLQNKGHLSIYKKDGLQKFTSRPSKFMISPEQMTQLQQIIAKYNEDIEWVGQTLTGTGLLSNGERSIPFSALGLDSVSLMKTRIHPKVAAWAKDLMTVDGQAFIDQLRQNPIAISATNRVIEVIQTKEQSIASGNELEKLPEGLAVQLAGKTVYRDLNAVDAQILTSHTTGYQLSDDSSIMTEISLLQNLYATEGVQNLTIFLKNDGAIDRVQRKIRNEFE